MADKQLKHGHELYTITTADGKIRAAFIPARGATCCSLRVSHAKKDRELLYLHDFFWEENWHDLPGGWPFLFPVCARVARNGKTGNYLYDGHLYEMPMHGFAWRMPWRVVDASKPDELVLCLRDTAQTQAMFPFSFTVTLIYKVVQAGMSCEQIYQNHSTAPMPYYAGFHPYFLTPQPGAGKEEVILDYRPVKQYRYNESFTDLIGEQPVFNVPAAITQPEINEQLTRVAADKMVKLRYPDGFSLRMEARGCEDADMFPYVQLYTRADKPFFCAEPWMGFPNAINTVSGIRWLQPGRTERAILRLMLKPMALP